MDGLAKSMDGMGLGAVGLMQVLIFILLANHLGIHRNATRRVEEPLDVR